MLRLAFILAMGLLFGGCNRRPPTPTAQAPATTGESAPAVVSEPDMGNVLAELTQTLRRYSAEKREVPTSLDALVSAGYLSQLPQAPAGKSFAIERKDVRVVLK